MNVTDQQKVLIEWARSCLANEFSGDIEDMADAIGYSRTILDKLFSKAGYEGDLDAALGALTTLRQRMLLSQEMLIRTPVSDRIRDGLDFAESMMVPTIVTGPTGRSKTLTAVTWCRERKRRIHVQLPSQCARWRAVQLICDAVGIKTDGVPLPTLEAQLLTNVSRKLSLTRQTLILDDAGVLLPTGKRVTGLGSMGIVKDLMDLVRCGLVVIMEDYQWQEMTSGKNKHVFAQTVGRFKYHVHLPGEPVQGEVPAILAEFVTDAPRDLAKEARSIVYEPEHLRALLGDLKGAAILASRESRPMTAGDLQKARRNRLGGTDWKIDKGATAA